MKNLPLFVLLGILSLFLSHTNPRHRQPYISHLSQDIETLCCRTSTNQNIQTCRQLQPFMVQLFKGMLHMHTEPPRDYLLWTQYTTRMPGFTVHAVGVGGEYVIWSEGSLQNSACNILHDVLVDVLEYKDEADPSVFNLVETKEDIESEICT